MVLNRLKPEEIHKWVTGTVRTEQKKFETMQEKVQEKILMRTAKRKIEAENNEAQKADEPTDATKRVTRSFKRKKNTTQEANVENVATMTQKLSSESKKMANASVQNLAIVSKHRATKATSSNRSTRKQRRKIVSSVLTMMPSLQKFEMVWAYVRGSPFWPGIVEGEMADGKYNIHFFGDYTTYKVHKSKIKHFYEGFTDYSKLTKIPKLLQKAVEESKIFIFEKNRPQQCFICQMLELKSSLHAQTH